MKKEREENYAWIRVIRKKNWVSMVQIGTAETLSGKKRDGEKERRHVGK